MNEKCGLDLLKQIRVYRNDEKFTFHSLRFHSCLGQLEGLNLGHPALVMFLGKSIRASPELLDGIFPKSRLSRYLGP